jgi:hypothetical protein
VIVIMMVMMLVMVIMMVMMVVNVPVSGVIEYQVRVHRFQTLHLCERVTVKVSGVTVIVLQSNGCGVGK